jgi:hypothetical protein
VGTTPGTPTPSAASPTPPPLVTPAPCVGDCNGDAQVSIDELITAVRIALDGRAPLECAAIDAAGDDQVTIDDLVRAVTNALSGCA